MKVDRCRQIDLILDDAYKISNYATEEFSIFSTRCNRLIKKRIAKLRDGELLELMKMIVVMEHHFNDIYLGKVTNGEIVSVLKKMAVNNNSNISVYNKAKRLYERYLDSIKSHSLIRRLIKINRAYKDLKTVANLYPTSRRSVDEDKNYYEFMEVQKAKKKFFNNAVDLNRRLDYFNEQEILSLKKKCKKHDNDNMGDVNYTDLLATMRNNQIDFEQNMNEVNSRV